MFTQAMPAFVDALRQAVPSTAIGPLAQALGNCAQPLTHRGGINLPGGRRGNQNGTFGPGAWDPSQYQNLFPGGDQGNASNYYNNVDIGGMNVNWNEGNRYDSQFYFPTNQVFNQNQYFGGPTFNTYGGANIDYITNQTLEGDTVIVNNITVDEVNGDPVNGPQGPPGAAGRDGQRGAPGAPGGLFAALPPGFFGPIRYLTGDPRVRFQLPETAAKQHRYMKDAWVRPAMQVNVPTDAISGAIVTVIPAAASINVPTDAISGGTLTLSPEPIAITVPATLSFDPETCSVSVDSTTTFYAFPTLPSYQSILGTAASSQTVTYATTATVTASVTAVAASTISVIAATTAASSRASVAAANGFVVKGLDAEFWERNPATVSVSRIDPKIAGINPAQVRVYQQ